MREPLKAAIIALLLEDKPPYVIAKQLRVSLSYVRNLKTMIKAQGLYAGRNVG